MIECEFACGAANTIRNGTKWFMIPTLDKITSSITSTRYIVYACSNLVFVLNESKGCVICSLKGHVKKITCLTVNKIEGYIEIISGSDDGQIILWQHEIPTPTAGMTNNNHDLSNWKKVEISSLSSSINAIHSLSFSTNNGNEKKTINVPSSVETNEIATFITASTSLGHVILYCRVLHMKESEITMTGTPIFYMIDETKTPLSQTPYCLLLTATDHVPSDATSTSSSHIYDKSVILFMGAVDSKIYVRAGSYHNISQTIQNFQKNPPSVSVPAVPNNGQTDQSSNITAMIIPLSALISSTPTSTPTHTPLLKSEGVLSGHEEWVTSLSVIHVSSNVLLVASGSKDSKIRLWRLVTSSYTYLNSNSNNDSTTLPLEISDPIISTNTNEVSGEEELEEEEEEVEVETAGKVNIIDDGDDDANMKNEARLNFKIASQSQSNNSASHSSVYNMHSIYLEALLVGHEDWITSVHWMLVFPNRSSSSSSSSTSSASASHIEESQLRLFSTSMDRNMVIWSSDHVTGEF